MVLTLLKSSRNWGFFFYRQRDLDDLARDGYRDIARKFFNNSEHSDPVKTEEIPIRSKPVFKSEARETFFDLHKDFFSPQDQKILKLILISGDDSPRPLIFLDNGNRLADSFKKMVESDMITGCRKKELENWIARNFQFRVNHEVKNFKPKYLNNIISTNQIPCKKPVLEVTRDKTSGKLMIRKNF